MRTIIKALSVFCSIALLFMTLPQDAHAQSATGEQAFLRITKVNESDKHDLEIVSLGSLIITGDQITTFDLTKMESIKNGDAYLLDLGAGIYSDKLYASLGIVFGHNGDTNDNLFAWYPEVGLILPVQKGIAATISVKRFQGLYDEEENIVMFGILLQE